MISGSKGQKGEKFFWFVAIGMAMGLTWGGCEQVSKPEVGKAGPLQIVVPAGTPVPEYHIPAEQWRVQHSKALNLKDFSERECLLCHNPQIGCQKCHKYVGAKEINLGAAAILWGNRENADK